MMILIYFCCLFFMNSSTSLVFFKSIIILAICIQDLPQPLNNCHIFYQKLLYKMDLSQQALKIKKNSPMILTVLNSPPRSQLKQIASPSSEYQLYAYPSKKIVLAAFKTIIHKSKLLPNLQVYEWRCQTQFPIVKTAFVSVRQNDNSSTQTVEITAFNQHCPLKLTQIYDMPIGQMLYLLKQTMLGFQRLYNKFGSFQILNSMIAINEKGFCRVWLNQNFALNSFPKREITESRMVLKIVTIIQSHSQQSKGSKKLFSTLRQCSSFLNALKTIEFFVKQSRMLVPTKFISISSTKQIPRFDMPPTIMSRQNLSETDSPVLITRFSIKDQKLNKFREALIKEELKSSQRDRKNSSSPMQIKRLKSEKIIKDVEGLISKSLKVSDQETAHTGKRNRTPNATQQFYCSPTKQYEINKNSKKKRPGWIEESSYIMQQTIVSNQSDKKKKQMTQSQAFNLQNSRSHDNRKFSCKISPSKVNQKSPSKNTYFGKKNNEPYFVEFNQLLNNQKSGSSPRKKVNQAIRQAEQQKLYSELSGSVLKNNGWVAKVSGLLDIPANLQQSFHQDNQQVSKDQKQIKLDMLNNVGRQQMLMSILHQQIEDLL